MKTFTRILILLVFILSLTTNQLNAQWEQVGPYRSTVNCFAAIDANLFAGIYGGIYLSTSNGNNWSEAGSGLQTDLIVNDFLVIPNGSGGSNIFAATDAGIYLSTDTGSNWTTVNEGLTNNYVWALAASPNGAGGTNLFAGTWGSGAFLSTDNGNSWTEIDTGLNSTYVRCFAVVGEDIFAGTWDNGVFLSTNNGTNWTEVNTGLYYTSIQSLAASNNGTGGTKYFPVGSIYNEMNNGSKGFRALMKYKYSAIVAKCPEDALIAVQGTGTMEERIKKQLDAALTLANDLVNLEGQDNQGRDNSELEADVDARATYT